MPSTPRALPTTGVGGVEHTDAECYTVTVPDDGAGAEQWARRVLGAAPAPVRAVIVLGWRRVLGLALLPAGAPDQVMGWAVQRRSPDGAPARADHVLLTARSSTMTAYLDVTVGGGHLTVTGQRVIHRRRGRWVWSVVRPIHRLVLSRSIRWAAARADRPAH